jgi:hypothetical protein
MGVPVKPKSWALGKNSLMALWFSPNCERWHSSKMKTMRLSRSGSSAPCRWLAVLAALLVALAVFVQREAELLDGGDDDLVGVVVGEQAAHEGGGVGVFLDAAFLERLNSSRVWRSRSLRSTTKRHLSMSGLSLSRVEALKEVSVLPLPVVCQM